MFDATVGAVNPAGMIVANSGAGKLEFKLSAIPPELVTDVHVWELGATETSLNAVSGLEAIYVKDTDGADVLNGYKFGTAGKRYVIQMGTRAPFSVTQP